MRRLVISLVVLLALLVAADFGAAAVFEHEVSQRAKQQFGLADDPSVKVGGFSFLAQVAAGEYDSVTVDAKGVPVQDVLRDVDVHADLRGITAPLSEVVSGSLKQIPVREVEGQVRIKAADVNRALQANQSNSAIASITNLTIEPAAKSLVATAPADGSETDLDSVETADTEGATAGVRLCGTVEIAGQSTELCVFSVISLEQGSIAIDAKRLELRSAAGTTRLPSAIEGVILEVFSRSLPTGELPFDVTPTAVTVQSGVLTVKGKASNVVLGQG
ncbi:hypothetical protein BJP25_30350 [Actinokineospora bangkokensis]|uniref:DUF2993 domain-containing protein n=1 Tax=Actinokineospora bangkokensis TaxID=1193682 RepID=A0A1Q9LGR0_9PSEU|nr:hypothetical protein BJP25_30350 [Actinokineospora bangkokensis]